MNADEVRRRRNVYKGVRKLLAQTGIPFAVLCREAGVSRSALYNALSKDPALRANYRASYEDYLRRIASFLRARAASLPTIAEQLEALAAEEEGNGKPANR